MSSNEPPTQKTTGFVFALIFSALAAGILLTGYLSYQSYERHFRHDVENQLASIGELKSSELTQWRNERYDDGAILHKNPNFSKIVSQFLDHRNDTALRSAVESWVHLYPPARYDQIRLFDSSGFTLFSVPAGLPPTSEVIADQVSKVLKSGQITIQDFYRSVNDNRVHLGIMIPVFDDVNEHKPLGVIWLRIDPEAYLYPLIQRWPTPSRSAETLLIRREGNEAVFLNELRFDDNSALVLRNSLDVTERPAVKAALGQVGIVEGVDYRGVEVIADLHKIPDSPWILVTKMDKAEIFAPIRERLWMTISSMIFLLIAAGAATGFFYRQQHVAFYLERYTVAKALSESEFLLQQAQKVANLGSYNLNVLTGNWISTDVLDRIFGIDANFARTVEGWTTIIHPSFKSEMAEYFATEVIGKRSRFDKEYQIIRQNDSETRWVHGLGELSFDSAGNPIKMIGTIQDVTERKLAEELMHNRLALSDLSQYKSLEELIQTALDVAEKLTGSNIGFFHFVDYDQENLTLQTWSANTLKNMCKADAKGEHYSISRAGVWVDCLRQRKPIIHNDYASLPDKKGLPEGHAPIIRELTVPVMRNDRVVAIIGVGNKANDYNNIDVNIVQELFTFTIALIERKQVEEAILRLNAELENRVTQRTAQLDASNKELEAFAYSVSHDLRAPLRAIDGFSRILLDEFATKLDEEGVRLLNVVRANTQQMDRLVTDLLDLSRTSRTDMQMVTVDMTKLVTSVVGELSAFEEPGNLQFSIANLPEAEVDFTLFRQVWRNLLGNAVKYSRPKPDRLIEVGGYVDNGEVIYFVKDNGTGFNPKYAHKLFGVFQRLHSATEFEGTGIGLAIVQRIVLRHAGRVWAEGELGVGATFYFALPLRKET